MPNHDVDADGRLVALGAGGQVTVVIQDLEHKAQGLVLVRIIPGYDEDATNMSYLLNANIPMAAEGGGVQAAVTGDSARLYTVPQIAAGDDHTVGLRADGTVVASWAPAPAPVCRPPLGI